MINFNIFFILFESIVFYLKLYGINLFYIFNVINKYNKIVIL